MAAVDGGVPHAAHCRSCACLQAGRHGQLIAKYYNKNMYRDTCVVECAAAIPSLLQRSHNRHAQDALRFATSTRHT